MAAGMGSLQGGLKQMNPAGPNGEILLEYSVYDALCAGFGITYPEDKPTVATSLKAMHDAEHYPKTFWA